MMSSASTVARLPKRVSHRRWMTALTTGSLATVSSSPSISQMGRTLPVKVTKPLSLKVSKPYSVAVVGALWLPKLPTLKARTPAPLGLYSVYVRDAIVAMSSGTLPASSTQLSKSVAVMLNSGIRASPTPSMPRLAAASRAAANLTSLARSCGAPLVP